MLSEHYIVISLRETEGKRKLISMAKTMFYPTDIQPSPEKLINNLMRKRPNR